MLDEKYDCVRTYPSIHLKSELCLAVNKWSLSENSDRSDYKLSNNDSQETLVPDRSSYFVTKKSINSH